MLYNWEVGGRNCYNKKILTFQEPCRTHKINQLCPQLTACKSFFSIDLAVTTSHDLFPREGNLTLLSGFCLERESTTVMEDTL